MKAYAPAMLALAVALLGLTALHALPWVRVETESFFGDADVDYIGTQELAQRGMGWRANGAGDAFGTMSTGLRLVEMGYVTGGALAAVGLVGALVRSVHARAGAGIGMVGALGLLAAVPFVAGHVLFFVGLSDYAAAIGGRGTTVTWGINYVTPAVALALLGLLGWHAAAATSWTRAPAHTVTVPVGGPEPAPATAAPAPLPSAAATPVGTRPLPLAREATLRRIAEARAHARTFAGRSAADPAMQTWLQQMTAYLDGLEARARQTPDAAALATIERDLERHVFALR